MLKKSLSQSIEKILINNGFDVNNQVVIEIPNNKQNGDFATNVAFRLTKILKKVPKDIAEDFVTCLSISELKDQLEFIPINGFINIKVSDQWLWNAFKEIQTKSKFPYIAPKTMLEYVSANPTGPLHIGHGRWAVLGSAIVSLLRYVGVDVDAEFYINDAGNQIKNFYDSVNAVKAGNPVPEDGYHGYYIHDLAKQGKDPLQVNLDSQKDVLKKAGSSFDCWYSEKTLHDRGLVDLRIENLKQKGVTYEKEGALWFKTSDYGDEKDRVLIKADGLYTYFAVDIAYHVEKVNRGYERIVNIWGADHHGYIQRVRAGLAALCGDKYLQDEALKIVIGQMVSLTRNGEKVKMSKRTGEMITFDEVLDEIGKDALRYFLLEKSADTHVEFDLELAKKTSSDNPVYYIQYAHARICSILRKIQYDESKKQSLETVDLNDKERDMVLLTLQFDDEIFESAKAMAPHRLVNYVLMITRQFHHFYETCPIMKAEESDKEKRVHILMGVKYCLAKCLFLLGISAPESM